MKILTAILILILALYTVTRKKPLEAIFGRTILSMVAVLLYVISAAPDVALAEALLGVVLSTFVYITLFRRMGKIRIGVVPVHSLFEKLGNTYRGLEYELVSTYARQNGYEIEITEYADQKELISSFVEGQVDMICGAVTRKMCPDHTDCYEILQTKFAILPDRRTVDLLTFKEYILKQSIRETVVFSQEIDEYVISIEKKTDLSLKFKDFYEAAKNSGKLELLRKKYVGD